mgnify:CR=1 FL=1
MATYSGYVVNASGASVDAGASDSLRELERRIRSQYGRGWTAVISRCGQDDADLRYEYEVRRWALRG